MSGSLLAGLALVAVTAAVATFALTAPVAARDHDDPIVIDHPRISVGRAKGMPPLQGSESSRWVLHDMDTPEDYERLRRGLQRQSPAGATSRPRIGSVPSDQE